MLSMEFTRRSRTVLLILDGSLFLCCLAGLNQLAHKPGLGHALVEVASAHDGGSATHHPGETMKRILVIEDDPAILQGLTSSLEMEHYEVLTATDGTRGHALAARPRWRPRWNSTRSET